MQRSVLVVGIKQQFSAIDCSAPQDADSLVDSFISVRTANCCRLSLAAIVDHVTSDVRTYKLATGQTLRHIGRVQ